MELTVAQVARAYGRTDRFVQLAVAGGMLARHRSFGRLSSVDDVAARAWSRALGRGRRWGPEVREAALDLLPGNDTPRLSSSERSRLRARLRVMSAQDIAHASGGLGAWARYRTDDVAGLQPAGPSAMADTELGLVPGRGSLTFARTDSLDRFELERDVVFDADGNLGVVERSADDDRRARGLLDTYLLGDTRESEAAAAELEGRSR